MIHITSINYGKFFVRDVKTLSHEFLYKSNLEDAGGHMTETDLI